MCLLLQTVGQNQIGYFCYSLVQNQNKLLLPLVTTSSIHVYHFCLHVVHFCSTWMTPCMQFEKIEGWSFWTGILVKGWRRIGQVRKYKKERNVEIVFKNYVYTQ